MKANDDHREETVQAFGAGALGGLALGAVLTSAIVPAPLLAAVLGSGLGGLLGGVAGIGVKALTDDARRNRR
jgi:hypothetical protein